MKVKSFSPWGRSALESLKADLTPIYQKAIGDTVVKLCLAAGSLWIVVWQNDHKYIAFRTAFSPTADLEIKSVKEIGEEVKVLIDSSVGKYKIVVSVSESSGDVLLNYKVHLTPIKSLNIPFWPKDILILEEENSSTFSGDVHIKQFGTRSGMMYFTTKKPNEGAVLYFQNLTSLNGYFNDTETSAADTVGGDFPELGFSLPVTNDKPLKADKEYLISDAFVSFNNYFPKNQFEIAENFINQLAVVYLKLPKPATQYHDYIHFVAT